MPVRTDNRLRACLLAVIFIFTLFGCSGCDGAEPVERSSYRNAVECSNNKVLYVVAGSSNARRLAAHGTEAFQETLAQQECQQAFVVRAAWGGARLVQTEGLDFHPDSEGEYYDRTVRIAQRAMDSLRTLYPSARWGGIIWNQGNEQREAANDPALTEAWFEAWQALYRAFVADLGGEFYHVVSGTDPLEEQKRENAAFLHGWREREVTTCVLDPDCKMVANMTDEVYREWAACGPDLACKNLWFVQGTVHWGDLAAERIMETAALGVLFPEPDL